MAAQIELKPQHRLVSVHSETRRESCRADLRRLRSLKIGSRLGAPLRIGNRLLLVLASVGCGCNLAIHGCLMLSRMGFWRHTL